MREQALPDEALAALPRLAGVEIGRYTGVRDTGGSPEPDVLDVDIRTFDGRRRFVQVAARMGVDVFRLGPVIAGEGHADRSMERIGAVRLSPMEVREAYRSGLLGANYSVRIPLPEDDEAPIADLLLRVEVVDALSGSVYRDEKTLRNVGRGIEREGEGTPSGREDAEGSAAPGRDAASSNPTPRPLARGRARNFTPRSNRSCGAPYEMGDDACFFSPNRRPRPTDLVGRGFAVLGPAIPMLAR